MALLLSSGLGAQEGPPESTPPSPEAPRASVNSPGPEGAGQGGQGQDQPQPQQSAPRLGAVEKPGHAEEPSREGGKEPARDDGDATERREAADLAAQQSMADAAMRMLDLTFAQIVVGILGIVGLGATVYYSRETARAAVAATAAALDSAKAAVESAHATKVQADTALASVRLAESTVTAQLRAYVHVKAVQGELLHGEAGRFRAKVLVQNFGATPAYAFRSRLSIAIKRHLSPDADFEGPPPDMLVVTSIIPSSGIVPLEIETDFTVDSYVEALKAGRWAFYVYGIFTYKDVFGVERFTKYRFSCTGNHPFEGGRFQVTPTGNDAS